MVCFKLLMSTWVLLTLPLPLLTSFHYFLFLYSPWSSAIGQREKMSPVIFQLETLSNISHYEIGLILKCHDVSFLNNRQNSRQNSHQNSPQSPNGGILLSLVNESCRGSNSTWKTGIASFFWFTNTRVGPIQNLELHRIDIFLKLTLFWTGWTKWSLRYQFFT